MANPNEEENARRRAGQKVQQPPQVIQPSEGRAGTSMRDASGRVVPGETRLRVSPTQLEGERAKNALFSRRVPVYEQGTSHEAHRKAVRDAFFTSSREAQTPKQATPQASLNPPATTSGQHPASPTPGALEKGARSISSPSSNAITDFGKGEALPQPKFHSFAPTPPQATASPTPPAAPGTFLAPPKRNGNQWQETMALPEGQQRTVAYTPTGQQALDALWNRPLTKAIRTVMDRDHPNFNHLGEARTATEAIYDPRMDRTVQRPGAGQVRIDPRYVPAGGSRIATATYAPRPTARPAEQPTRRAAVRTLETKEADGGQEQEEAPTSASNSASAPPLSPASSIPNFGGLQTQVTPSFAGIPLPAQGPLQKTSLPEPPLSMEARVRNQEAAAQGYQAILPGLWQGLRSTR